MLEELEELIDGIAWTAEDRALVYASRRRPNPAYLRATIDHISSVKKYGLPLVVAEWATEVREYCERETTGAVARMRAGLGQNPSHWQPAVERALVRAAAPQAPEPHDVDAEAVLVALEVCPLFAAMPYWLAREGIPFALRALVRCHQIVGDVKINGYSRGVNWVVERAFARHDSYDTAWHLLRGSLAEAVEPVYDEALQIADGLRFEADAMLQGLIAFAFPDERAWAEQAGPGMIEIAGTVAKGYTPALARYVSVAPLAIARKVVGCTTNTALTRGDFLTMLAHEGAIAAKVLDEATRSASSHEIRREYARVLLVVRTADAAKRLDSLGDLWPNALRPLWRMHAKAMAKLADKPGKKKPAAKKPVSKRR